jgi:hypothetical protein
MELVITNVVRGSLADKAYIRIGDVIEKINGIEPSGIDNSIALFKEKGKISPSNTIVLQCRRKKELFNVQVSFQNAQEKIGISFEEFKTDKKQDEHSKTKASNIASKKNDSSILEEPKNSIETSYENYYSYHIKHSMESSKWADKKVRVRHCIECAQNNQFSYFAYRESKLPFRNVDNGICGFRHNNNVIKTVTLEMVRDAILKQELYHNKKEFISKKRNSWFYVVWGCLIVLSICFFPLGVILATGYGFYYFLYCDDITQRALRKIEYFYEEEQEAIKDKLLGQSLDV